MMKFSVQTEVDKNLAALVKSLKFKDPLSKSVKLLKQETQQNFDQQGRIYGLWKPLAQSTRRQRERLGFNGARPILVRTGRLKRGFVTSSTSDKAEISNTANCARYHQMGGKRLPQRKILGTSSKSKKAIPLLFANFIADQIKKHMGLVAWRT